MRHLRIVGGCWVRDGAQPWRFTPDPPIQIVFTAPPGILGAKEIEAAVRSAWEQAKRRGERFG